MASSIRVKRRRALRRRVASRSSSRGRIIGASLGREESGGIRESDGDLPSLHQEPRDERRDRRLRPRLVARSIRVDEEHEPLDASASTLVDDHAATIRTQLCSHRVVSHIHRRSDDLRGEPAATVVATSARSIRIDHAPSPIAEGALDAGSFRESRDFEDAAAGRAPAAEIRRRAHDFSHSSYVVLNLRSRSR